MAGSALALVMLVLLINLVVVQYSIGALSGALDEGSRAGALGGGDKDVCELVSGSAVSELLNSTWTDVQITCWSGPSEMSAGARMRISLWLPGLPTWEVERTAHATLELSA